MMAHKARSAKHQAPTHTQTHSEKWEARAVVTCNAVAHRGRHAIVSRLTESQLYMPSMRACPVKENKRWPCCCGRCYCVRQSRPPPSNPFNPVRRPLVVVAGAHRSEQRGDGGSASKTPHNMYPTCIQRQQLRQQPESFSICKRFAIVWRMLRVNRPNRAWCYGNVRVEAERLLRWRGGWRR